MNQLFLIAPNKSNIFQVLVNNKWELRSLIFNLKDYSDIKCTKLFDNSILFICTNRFDCNYYKYFHLDGSINTKLSRDSRFNNRINSFLQNRSLYSLVSLNNGDNFIIGGLVDGYPMNSILGFNFETSKYATIKMKTGLIGASAVVLSGGRILIIGGTDHTNNSTKTCQIFDPITCKFTYTKSMHYARAFSSCVLLPNGNIFVSGGENNDTIYNSCEEYDIIRDEWVLISPMINSRSKHTSILIDSNNVLVLGGITNLSVSTLTCEIYNISTKKWNLSENLLEECVNGSIILF